MSAIEFTSPTYDAGKWHEYSRFYCANCGNTLTVPVYCGDRFCDICGTRRRLRVRKRLAYMVEHSQTPAYQGLKFLTLTIKSTDDLPAGLRHLMKSFAKLRSRRWWKMRVSGGAYVIEITHGDAGWHVHLHCLIMARFLPFDTLKRLWHRVSGAIHVDIRPCPTTNAVRYLTKYLTKPETTPEMVGELNRAFSGVRMFQPFGSWQMLRDPEPRAKCQCTACMGQRWLLIGRPSYMQVAFAVVGQGHHSVPSPSD